MGPKRYEELDSWSKFATFSLGVMFIAVLVGPTIVATQWSLPSSSDISEGQTEGTRPLGRFSSSYTTHDPINITSNSDFDSLGFPGSGTTGDPYLIENYNITAAETCISITNTDAFFAIQDCILTSSEGSDDVSLENVVNGEIQGNIANGNSDSGIRVNSSSYNSIVGNTITGVDVGLRITYSSNISVIGNTITGKISGVQLASSSFNALLDNTILDSNWRSVVLDSSSDNTLSSNIMDIRVTIRGVELKDWRQKITSDNIVLGKPVGYFWNMNGGVIDGSEYGQVILANCSEVTVENGIFVSPPAKVHRTPAPIELAYSTYCILSNNTVLKNWVGNGYGSGTGIHLFYSNNNTLVNNTITGNRIAMELTSSSFNTMDNNTISDNRAGVRLSHSSHNRVANNAIIRNSGPGVVLGELSNNNTLTNNNISGNSAGVSMEGYGYMFAVPSIYNKVMNNVISNNSVGVSIHDCLFNSVVNNTIMRNSNFGMFIQDSSNNTVSGNTISNNSGDGVIIFVSSNNTVSSNTISDNSGSGVDIEYSSNNTVVGNTISENSHYGIYVNEGSENNLIYLNLFSYNENGSAYDNGVGNHWNTTGIGNSWSDYDGNGVYHIPGTAGSIDHYPANSLITPSFMVQIAAACAGGIAIIGLVVVNLQKKRRIKS
ncbi:MAG: NosD domain-containing protein [Candidatus Thorarchaeota archaeon]|jgi:parallel beta-helix repeat protein